jgi:serine phosphatase RsbU (regulator of sigma subunit)
VVLGIVIPSSGFGTLLYISRRDLLRKTTTENEMQVARQMKEEMLLKPLPALPGWKLSIFYKPSSIASGDVCDFMYLPDGRLMITIGEVEECGISAMLKMATWRTAIRGATHRSLSPGETLECANTLICPEMDAGKSINCFYGIFDCARGTLKFAYTGHHQAYLMENRDANELNKTCAPLGLSLDYLSGDGQVTFRPGERFLLCNEWIAALSNQAGEPFGRVCLGASLAVGEEESPRTVESIMGDLKSFAGKDWEPGRDLVMMLLELDPKY